jgi:hypothetical protein
MGDGKMQAARTIIVHDAQSEQRHVGAVEQYHNSQNFTKAHLILLQSYSLNAMSSGMILPVIAVAALLQNVAHVSAFVVASSSLSTKSYFTRYRTRNCMAPLRAEKDDNVDDLSNNFLNFLKKSKEEEDEEEEEEEEIEESSSDDEKIKPNLFNEIVSGQPFLLWLKSLSSLDMFSFIPSRMTGKSTKFDRVVSDFVGKRYGAGAAFYGARASDLSEAEYAEMTGVNKGEVIPDEEKILKDNAILIFGSLNQIGQWVAFELNEKGFQIRVACSDKQEAIKIFGLNNVDIVELKKGASEQQYARAIQGVQAVVFCQNFQPKIDFLNGVGKAETDTALSLLDIAVRAKEAGVSSVKKIVVVSRTIPNKVIQSKEGDNLLNAIINGQSDNKIYSQFREMHSSFETLVRKAGFEYTVVRAPPVVEVRNFFRLD